MAPVSHIQSLSTISKFVKGCILIFEYSYFYLQAKADQKDIIALAVKECQESRIQSSIVVALQHIIQEYNEDHIKLQQAILDIIVENRMCKFVLFINTWNLESSFVSANKFNLVQQPENQAWSNQIFFVDR